MAVAGAAASAESGFRRIFKKEQMDIQLDTAFEIIDSLQFFVEKHKNEHDPVRQAKLKEIIKRVKAVAADWDLPD
jgi:hypothetical protein